LHLWGENNVLRFQHKLKPGAEVRLIASPLAEQLRILERLDDSGRIRALLNIMGGIIRVHLPRDYAIAA